MRITKEKLTLKCFLTDDQKISYSEEQSKALVEKSAKEAELKAYSGEIKSEILSLDAKIVALANKINNGYEHRAVECKVEYDWTNKTKRWIRLDDYSVAKDDIISEKELQEEVPLPETN